MASTIPVPIQFSLPEGWQAAPPDEVGAPDAAFVALRPPASNGFTPNITLSGELRGNDVPLTQVADEAITRLEHSVGPVQVGTRKEVGSGESPGFTQAVRMSITLHGEQQDVVQFQVFITMRDTKDASRKVVLHAVLSSTPDRFEQVIGEFQTFLSTVKPDQAESPSA